MATMTMPAIAPPLSDGEEEEEEEEEAAPLLVLAEADADTVTVVCPEEAVEVSSLEEAEMEGAVHPSTL